MHSSQQWLALQRNCVRAAEHLHGKVGLANAVSTCVAFGTKIADVLKNLQHLQDLLGQQAVTVGPSSPTMLSQLLCAVNPQQHSRSQSCSTQLCVQICESAAEITVLQGFIVVTAACACAGLLPIQMQTFLSNWRSRSCRPLAD